MRINSTEAIKSNHNFIFLPILHSQADLALSFFLAAFLWAIESASRSIGSSRQRQSGESRLSSRCSLVLATAFLFDFAAPPFGLSLLRDQGESRRVWGLLPREARR